MTPSWTSLSRVRLAAALAAAFLATAAASRAAGPVTSSNVTAELVSGHASIEPGRPFTVGVSLRPDSGWHTYWRNPGHTGLPTKVKWTLPEGFRAGDLEWPHPVRLGEPPFVTYGYEGDALLLATIEAPASASGRANIAAEVKWLACREDGCIPGKAELSLELPVRGGAPSPDPRWTGAFADARAALPRALPGWSASMSPSDERVRIEVRAPEDARPSTLKMDVFPVQGRVLDSSATPSVEVTPEGFAFEVPRDPDAKELPEELDLVLVAEGGWNAGGDVRALALRATSGAAAGAGAATTADAATGAAKNATAAASGGSASSASPEDPAGKTAPGAGTAKSADPDEPQAAVMDDAAPPLTLLAALLSAFVGGLILNLMPCVFPVLSLKVLGFVHVAHHDPVRVRRHGYVFAIGVLVSFWVLAGLLLALRAAGSFLGWGFQLQEPAFVAAVALLLFAMSLNLLGVFELGASISGALGRLDSEQGYRGSFLSGVLATVLATPCSAPFMGSAVGFALAQSAAVSMAVFTSLGLGMAAPYVVLACAPVLLRRLPRPGAWMEVFREAMAFPLLATVAWLVWVFGQETGNDGVLGLLLGLLLLGLGIWLGARAAAMASTDGPRRAARAFGALAIVASLVVSVSSASRTEAVASATHGEAEEGSVPWVAWDESAIDGHRREGRAVLVDFTAAWCLSCKVNERVALSSEDFVARLAERNVVAMKADWTNGDPAITRALESFGRSGVPLYVVYPRNPDAAPIVLPEILTPDLVDAALLRATS